MQNVCDSLREINVSFRHSSLGSIPLWLLAVVLISSSPVLSRSLSLSSHRNHCQMLLRSPVKYLNISLVRPYPFNHLFKDHICLSNGSLIHYVVHYFWPGPIAHYIANRLQFGTQNRVLSLSLFLQRHGDEPLHWSWTPPNSSNEHHRVECVFSDYTSTFTAWR